LWQSKPGHNALSVGVSWSPDSRFIANSYFDSAVVIWDLNGSAVKRLEPNGADSRGKARDAAGPSSFGGNGAKPSCDTPDPTDNSTYLPTRAIAWSPDGRHLAIGGDDTNVTIYNTTDWKVWKVFTEHEGSVLSLDWSRDGKYLASGSGLDNIDPHNQQTPENMIKIWDMSSGRRIANLTGHKDSVMCVKWSPNGKTLASVSDNMDRSVKLWDTATWTNVRNMTGHGLGVLGVDWSPDGKYVVSGSRDFTVRVWFSTNGTLSKVFRAPNCQRSVSWHPSGKFIASSGPAESMLIVWNVSSGSKTMFSESGQAGSTVYSCRWSPDGAKLAASSGKEHLLRLYGFGAGVPPGLTGPQWLTGALVFLAIAIAGSAVILIVGGRNWWRKW
jgi:WD40 repeat protein